MGWALVPALFCAFFGRVCVSGGRSRGRQSSGVDTYKSRVWALAEPIAAGLGLEVLEVEAGGGGARRLIRIYLDSPGGARAVTVEDCEQASRRIGDLLDAHEATDNDYMLEVSSPGLDRPLRKREHFERVLGGRIKAKTSSPHQGRRNFVGTLEAIENDRLTIRADDGESYELELADLDKANFEYDFGTTARNVKKRPNQ